MSKMSFLLSSSLARGRAGNGAPPSQEVLLVRLLRKRSAAHQAGQVEQEKMLRNQIGWSLPMRSPADE